MTLQEYSVDDYPVITKWFNLHSIPAPLPQDLPKLGFIAPGIAVGFLLQSDASVAFLEAFVTNPAAHQQERSEALDAIAKELIGRAHQSGFRYLRCFSRIGAIKRRSISLGFKNMGEIGNFLKEL